MATMPILNLAEVEQRVCDIAAEQLGFARERVSPTDRMIEDLQCDSLDLVELFMEVEEAFEVTLVDNPTESVYKAVFTRQPFRLSDLAELVYLSQGSGSPDRGWWGRRDENEQPLEITVPFTQLGGRWLNLERDEAPPLFEPLPEVGSTRAYRRRSDGMRCLLVPSARVEIGGKSMDAPVDEHPCHVVEIDAFLIDAEPVSTTAFCRFLNSIGHVDQDTLKDWFVLDAGDDRDEHQLIARRADDWQPLPGTERWPMILVSWYGASAYSLWANGADWKTCRDQKNNQIHSYLPTEAQWEYSARGAISHEFPWGDQPVDENQARFGRHRRGMTYNVATLPLADVNSKLGMSPFGLHHMAGNVWQWCRDWYHEDFYKRSDASRPNPVDDRPGTVKSERGGSWIGPASLCRSSFRRGRPPLARGRCLGFRCVSPVP